MVSDSSVDDPTSLTVDPISVERFKMYHVGLLCVICQ